MGCRNQGEPCMGGQCNLGEKKKAKRIIKNATMHGFWWVVGKLSVKKYHCKKSGYAMSGKKP